MASSGRIDELRKKFEENPRRYFAPLANEYRKVGDLQQAILICQEHLPQQPGHMSGHIVYGQALFEAGKLDEARGIFETALTLDPENLIALRHLGDIARASGNTDVARGWYKRVLEADPRNEEIGQIMAAMGGEGSAPAATPTVPDGTPVQKPSPAPASPKPATAAAAAPTAELSVEAIRQLAAARAAQTAPRQSGARVMPAVPLDSLPTLVPGVPKVPETPIAAEKPEEKVAPSRPSRRLSRSVTPLDWNAVQDTPAAGTPTQGTGYAGDTTDLLEIPNINLGTPSRPSQAVPEQSGELLDLGAGFQADPLAITTQPAQTRPPADESLLEGLETTSLSPPPAAAPQAPPSAPTPAPAPTADLPLLDLSMDLPSAAAPQAPAPTPAPAQPPAAVPEFSMADEAPAPAQPAAPFVTTTMAELYVQQGHLEAALDIYKQLAAKRPGDPDLTARMQDLERQIGLSSAPPPSAPDLPMIAPEPVAQVAPAEEVLAPEQPRETEAASGPTIREFLLALVSGTADQLFATNGVAHPDLAAWATIDALFGGMPIADADETAAEMLGIAFDDNREVALLFEHSVPVTAASAPTTDAGAERFSLDQFFSSQAGGVAGRRSNS